VQVVVVVGTREVVVGDEGVEDTTNP